MILEREKKAGREGEREKERETLICSTYLSIHWLFLVCALPGNRTYNLFDYGMMLQPTEPPGQGKLLLLFINSDGVSIGSLLSEMLPVSINVKLSAQ